MARDFRWVVRLAPTVLVALVVCHLIRAHVLEWYRVPSHSMEPTLHGDPASGDVVLVDKTAFWNGEPAAFDLVVLRDRDDPGGQIVKRLIATGNDAHNVVALDRGDVFVGATRQTLERVVKDPAEARDLRIPHFVFPELGAVRVERYFHPSDAWRVDRTRPALSLAPAPDLASLAAELDAERQRQRRAAPGADPYLPGHLSTAEPVDTRYLDAHGDLAGRSETYPDVGMELVLEPAPGFAGLQLVFEHQDTYYALQIEPSGRGTFVRGGCGAPQSDRIAFSAGAPLAPGVEAVVSFGYLDGALFLEVAGAVVWHRRCDLAPPGPSAFATPGMPYLLHVAAAGAPLSIRRLVVFHDVYYRPLAALYGPAPAPVELQPGELFLLGDNPFDSRDSRTGRMFRRDDLLGRPIAILGPAARRRWLRR